MSFRSSVANDLARRALCACAVALGALALRPIAVHSQAATPRLIATEGSEFAEPVSAVGRLVELRDGGVLIYDGRERRLSVLDFQSGAVRDIARVGAGPLEYRSVNALLRLPGDSILLWDGGNARTMLLAPDATPVGTSRLESGGNPLATLSRPVAREVDARGRWYALAQGITLTGGVARTADSAALVRMERSTGTLDTLIKLAVTSTPAPSVVDGVVRVRAVGFVPQPAWGVFPDGRVLVIHSARYQPEVITPDGKRQLASPIAHAQIPVSASDREAHLARVRSMMNRASGSSNGPRMEVVEPERWQAYHPALKSEYLHVDSRGRAWAYVMEADSSRGARYDLIDASGRRVDAIRFARGVKVVGMGRGVVYATREDEDGLLFLQRYRLP